MANSEFSKLKVLFLYDYFLHEVGPTETEGVTVQDLIDLLKRNFDTEFERKSIYSDISRINEYANTMGLCKGDFIGREGKKYVRGLLNDEIMLEEAKMISDSLRTTEFISDELCRKFELMFPAYFSHEANAYVGRLYSRHIRRDSAARRRQLMNIQNILVMIRASMEKRYPIVIKYGYKGGESKWSNDYLLTPLKIDWTNSHYYLIAIDHEDLYKRIGFDKKPNKKQLCGSIKRFRLDRIIDDSPSDNTYVTGKDNLEFLEKRLPDHYNMLFDRNTKGRINKPEKRIIADQYMTFLTFGSEDEQSKVVDAYINNSLDAFSSDKTPVSVRLSIQADMDPEADENRGRDPWKQVLIAFSAIKDEFDVKDIREIRNDQVQKINFTIVTPQTKTLYKHLFSIYTMEGVRFNIENEEIRNEMLAYINKIRGALLN
ncbi:MAG: WYL domain-containing protein [Clostridiales bacterium]|nr:WYL domain-containing protein [Clostridiales bacterium]